MPTYSYSCSNCNHTWDGLYKIADRKSPEIEPCPNCKAENSVSQQVSPVSFGDPVRMGFAGKDRGFRDVIEKVHMKTPGSQLDKLSTINKL